jgi:hypothetical protein
LDWQSKSTTPLHLVAARLAKGAPILGLSSKIAKLTDFVSLSCGNRCEIDSRKVETESTNSRFLQEQRQLLPLRKSSPVGWLRLSKATSLMDHDVQKARVALERGISKSWLIRPGGIPQPVSDPNVPLRIQVVPSSGWRLEGRAWLDSPVAVLGGFRNRMSRQTLGTVYSRFVVNARQPNPSED